MHFLVLHAMKFLSLFSQLSPKLWLTFSSTSLATTYTAVHSTQWTSWIFSEVFTNENPYPCFFPPIFAYLTRASYWIDKRLCWLQDKNTSSDNLDDILTSGHGCNIPSLCISSQWYPLRFNCFAWNLLRGSVFHNGSMCLRALWFETFWCNLQLHAARQSYRCTTLLRSACWLCLRLWSCQAAIIDLSGWNLLSAYIPGSSWCLWAGHHLEHNSYN